MIKLKRRIPVLMGLAIAIAIAEFAAAAPALPAAVDKTFKATFPRANFMAVKSTIENYATLYTVELMDGNTNMVANIAADGSLLGTTAVHHTRLFETGS